MSAIGEMLVKYKKYDPGKDDYGDAFMFMDTRNEYELALPILIGK